MSDLDERGRLSDGKLAVVTLLVEAVAASIPDEAVSKAEFRAACDELKRALSIAELIALVRELAERRAAEQVN